MLYTAWNELMIGRPVARWTSMALAFIAMFSDPWTAPKTKSARHSVTRSGMSAGGTSTSPSATAAGSMTRRLPNRSTTRPIDCMPVMAPAANARSAKLSQPSLRSRPCLMAGMRAVHVPSVMPKRRKTSDVAMRPRCT